MRALWTGIAILLALLLETALGRLVPGGSRLFDPFLLVMVYCALAGGEAHGMLAGMAAGWVQDVHFGGPVLGLSAFTKLLLGYAAGLAAGHLLIAGPAARALVLLVATLADAVVFQWLAAVFDVQVLDLSPLALASRATVNAVVGALLFELLDRRLARGFSG
ncbi:MAG TPA: rod shape-determining protein MreD [Vicinamibacteria bacterium]|nr:rod shape-determining protein MreD [Vicinamibacteria bacterium]